MSFDGANTEQCLSITIVNDGVREDINEEFTLVLSTGDSDIDLFPATAQVILIDNNSKEVKFFRNITPLIRTLLHSHLLINYLTLAIALEFGQINYRLVEGQSASVCVLLLGETDRSVEATLTSVPNSATG